MGAALSWFLEATNKIKADRRIIRLNVATRNLLSRLRISLHKHRKSISIVGSLALHLLVILAFLIPKPSVFASIGTTGEGTVDGAGFTVSLVAAKEASKPVIEPTSLPVDPTPTNNPEQPTETPPPLAEADTQTLVTPPAQTQPVTPASQTDKPTTAPQTAQAGAGAAGHNGKATGDLWSAIAPCWNRIADKDTLPATLKVSFSATGSLSVPPVIERDPTAPITDQTLRSEAKAIAALAQCGAYAMAQGQQDVEVKFPTVSPASSRP